MPVTILDIADVSLSEGTTSYPALTILERSMLYRLLLEQVRLDPGLQVAQMLENLIAAEQRLSRDRASIIALGAARAYLQYGDPINGRRFFQIHLDHEASSIHDTARSLESARVGTALLAAGHEGDLELNSDAYQARLKEREAQGGDLENWKASENRNWRGALRSTWSATLAGQGALAVEQLYAGLPAEFSEATAEQLSALLLKAESMPDASADVRSALGILKNRAVAREDWVALADLSFFEQEYENYRVARGVRPKTPPPAYRPFARALFDRVPAGQLLVLLVDTPDTALRLTVRDRQVQAVPLKVSGRYLRGRLEEYLAHARSGREALELHQELGRVYRSLFGIGQSGVLYYWLGGVHSLAPIPPIRGDRLVQILDPRVLLDRPVLRAGQEFGDAFLVRLIPAADTGRYPTADDALFFERLAEMERLSLGPQASGKEPDQESQARHVQAPAFPQSPLPALELSPTAGPWFYTGNRLTLAPRREVANYNALLYSLASSLRGPGVVTMRAPDSASHAYFVRYYYNRGLPARSIFQRYLTAYFSARGVAGTSLPASEYGYRLVTTNFLQE